MRFKKFFDREKTIQKNAMDYLLNAIWKKEHVLFAILNLLIHSVIFVPTKLQGTWIDNVWEKMMKS